MMMMMMMMMLMLMLVVVVVVVVVKQMMPATLSILPTTKDATRAVPKGIVPNR